MIENIWKTEAVFPDFMFLSSWKCKIIKYGHIRWIVGDNKEPIRMPYKFPVSRINVFHIISHA